MNAIIQVSSQTRVPTSDYRFTSCDSRHSVSRPFPESDSSVFYHSHAFVGLYHVSPTKRRPEMFEAAPGAHFDAIEPCVRDKSLVRCSSYPSNSSTSVIAGGRVEAAIKSASNSRGITECGVKRDVKGVRRSSPTSKERSIRQREKPGPESCGTTPLNTCA